MHANPSLRYAARREAGWALKQTTRRQKHLAEILAVDQSTVSRYVRGEIGSAASEFYEFVARVARDPAGDAGDAIAGAVLTAEQAVLDLPLEELVHRFRECSSQETHTQAREDVAQHRAAFAIACLLRRDPTSAELREARAALEAYDDEARPELGDQVNTLIYGRAIRRKMGWRAEP